MAARGMRGTRHRIRVSGSGWKRGSSWAVAGGANLDDGHEYNFPATVSSVHVVEEPYCHGHGKDEGEPLGAARDRLLPWWTEVEDQGVVESGVDDESADCGIFEVGTASPRKRFRRSRHVATFGGGD
jgi:hypothetical protein